MADLLGISKGDLSLTPTSPITNPPPGTNGLHSASERKASASKYTEYNIFHSAYAQPSVIWNYN